jgi:hypothetical protein
MRSVLVVSFRHNQETSLIMRTNRVGEHHRGNGELAGGQASAASAAKIAADPWVAYVRQDVAIRLDAVQTPTPSWGLDRIDQRVQPLSNSYTFTSVASTASAGVAPPP